MTASSPYIKWNAVNSVKLPEVQVIRPALSSVLFFPMVPSIDRFERNHKI